MKKQEIIIRVVVEAPGRTEPKGVKESRKAPKVAARRTRKQIPGAVYESITGMGVGSSYDISDQTKALNYSPRKLEKRINAAMWYYKRKDGVDRRYSVNQGENGVYATRVQ